jgi:hypothetical protein
MTTDGEKPRRSFAQRMSIPVERRWLHATAGAVWTGVGVLLITYAVIWLAPDAPLVELTFAALGLIVAALFVRFVFAGIVRKNIARIEAGPARVSIFAFQGWKSYLIAAVMIALGIVLRTSALPKDWLAIVYEGVGVALLLTSLLYHRQLVRSFRDDAQPSDERQA